MLSISGNPNSYIYQLDASTDKFVEVLSTGPTIMLCPIRTTNSYKNETLVAVSIPDITEKSMFNTAVVSGIYSVTHPDKTIENSKENVGDYLPIASNVVITFEEGQTLHTVALTIMDDYQPEDIEDFKVLFIPK